MFLELRARGDQNDDYRDKSRDHESRLAATPALAAVRFIAPGMFNARRIVAETSTHTNTGVLIRTAAVLTETGALTPSRPIRDVAANQAAMSQSQAT
jgi:hypothetical protein